MKKNYTLIFRNTFSTSLALIVVLLLSIFIQRANAQVSVTATAGTTGPTVYSTLKLAFDAINAGTHKGVITISLTASTEEGSTPAILNSSAISPASYTSVLIRPVADGITINGNGTAASRGLIELLGADNVTIDGDNPNTSGTNRNLTISSTSVNASVLIWMESYSATDGATGNTFKNCNFIGQSNSTTIAALLSGSSTFGSAAAAANSNTIFQNNSVSQMQNGIFQYGYATSPFDANWMITGNTFGSTVAASKMGFRGMICMNASGLTVSNNIVQGVTFNGSSTVTGIQLSSSVLNVNIFGNKISDIKNTSTTGYGSNGIMLGATTTASNVTVYNNFISDVASNGYTLHTYQDNGYGIAIISGGGYNLYFNTVYMNTSQTATGYPAALLINTVSTNSTLNIRNNIFAITETVGTTYCVYSAATAARFADINYNDYYTTGTNIGYRGSNCSTIAAWRTATTKDANSVAVNPLFVSASDLHLQAGSTLAGIGTSISGITTDIDGDIRGASPVIGADEFISCVAPGITTHPSTSTQNYCLNATATALSVTASGTVTGYQWYKNTTASNSGGTLLSGATSSSYTPLTTAAGTLYYYCIVSNTNCTTKSNVSGAIIVNSPPTITLGTSPVACFGNTTFNLLYTTTTGSPDQYSIDYDVNAEAAGFTDIPLTSLTASPISLNLPVGLALGTYNATISLRNNALNCNSSSATAFTLTVNAYPSITIQPSTSTQNVCQYATATYLAISASNALSYQWYSNVNPVNSGGTLISGATSSSYLPSSTVNGTLYYYCVVSNTAYCTTTSDVSGAVVVTASPANPGAISSNTPQCNGTGVTFTAGACTGGSCYWVSSASGIETDNPIAINPTLTTASNAGTYHVWIRAFDGLCWSLSTTAIAIVNPTSIGGNLTGGSSPLCYGVATGTLSLSGYTGTIVRWEKQVNSGGWTTIANTLNTYAETPASAGTWEYRAVVQSGVCPEAYSNSIVIVVNPLPDPVSVATAGTYCTNTTLTASGGNGGTIYWENTASNGTSISTPSLSELVSASGTYYFRAQTSLGCWGVQGSAAVTINVLPSISANPWPKVYCAGESTLFSLVATGTPTLIYQWQYSDGTSWTNVANGTPTGATYTNSTAATMTVAGVTAAGVYPYQCIVTNGCGSTSSNSASLTVHLNPIVGVSPTSALYCGGTAITLTANGASTYAWTPTTALSASTGTTVNASPAGTTIYTVTGTDGNGCISTATTTITAGPSPSAVTINPTTATICPGGTQALVASGGVINAPILTENFNGTPTGWTQTNSSVGGTTANAAWALYANGYTYSVYGTFHSNDNSQFVMSNSDYQGILGTSTATILKSPAFSTLGYSSASINFYQYYYYQSGGTAKVEASIDGNTWTTLQTYTSTQGAYAAFASSTVALTAPFINQPIVYIRFNYYDVYGYWWAIDNVSITGTASTTIVWSPVTELYTDAGATASYAGGAATSLWSKPSSNITYTATATSGIGCTSLGSTTITINHVPAPTGNATQNICFAGTVASLLASGTAIKWYDAATGGNLLLSTTPLTDGSTYYATQTIGGCESPGRLAVTTTISTTTAPTGNPVQVFLNAATVADLAALGVDVKWYDASTGGNLLLSTDLLIDGHTYYASQTISGCESQTRFETSVVIILIKTVNLHLFLQGLYDYNAGNTMVEAQDIDWGTGITFPKYGAGIADRIQVELYEGNPPFTTPLVNISGIDLLNGGLASFQISPNFNGNYYIRVISRNHLEVWSANPISFNASNINYDFTTNGLQAYQAPGGIDPQTLLSTGVYGLYLGDLDQSLGVDFDDFNVFEPYLTDGSYGFTIADFNGSGLVDFDDFNLFEPVLNFGPFAQYPGMAKK
ncbi:MAG: hypothetical protein WCH34_13320 [Bacteroidota bacterium]